MGKKKKQKTWRGEYSIGFAFGGFASTIAIAATHFLAPSLMLWALGGIVTAYTIIFLLGHYEVVK